MKFYTQIMKKKDDWWETNFIVLGLPKKKAKQLKEDLKTKLKQQLKTKTKNQRK